MLNFYALERLIDFHLQNGTDAILTLVHHRRERHDYR